MREACDVNLGRGLAAIPAVPQNQPLSIRRHARDVTWRARDHPHRAAARQVTRHELIIHPNTINEPRFRREKKSDEEYACK